MNCLFGISRVFPWRVAVFRRDKPLVHIARCRGFVVVGIIFFLMREIFFESVIIWKRAWYLPWTLRKPHVIKQKIHSFLFLDQFTAARVSKQSTWWRQVFSYHFSGAHSQYAKHTKSSTKSKTINSYMIRIVMASQLQCKRALDGGDRQ